MLERRESVKITEFHEKLKQHCAKINGDCRQCCLLDYCYSQKQDVNSEFVEKIIDFLLNCEDNDKDISCQVIRNPDNVCYLEENNKHI